MLARGPTPALNLEPRVPGTTNVHMEHVNRLPYRSFEQAEGSRIQDFVVCTLSSSQRRTWRRLFEVAVVRFARLVIMG